MPDSPLQTSGPKTKPRKVGSPKAKPAESATNRATVAPKGNISVDLGLPSLVDLQGDGYLPSRPEVMLTKKARAAVKRLSLTLDQSGAKLSDGTQVRGSAQKTIVWLCERLADTLGEE